MTPEWDRRLGAAVSMAPAILVWLLFFLKCWGCVGPHP